MKKILMTLAVAFGCVCMAVGQTERKHQEILESGTAPATVPKTVGKIELVPEKPDSEAAVENRTMTFNSDSAFRRLLPASVPKPYSFDFRVQYGMKLHPPLYVGQIGNRYSAVLPLYLSASALFRYYLYKGLYAGIGVEPTLYYADKPEQGSYMSKIAFYLPVDGKIGYNLRFLDISVGSEYGIFESSKSNFNFQQGKMNNMHIDISIPIK